MNGVHEAAAVPGQETPPHVEEERAIAVAAIERLHARLATDDRLTALTVALAVPEILDGLYYLLFTSGRVLDEFEDANQDDQELSEAFRKVRAASTPGAISTQAIQHDCRVLARSLARAHRRSLPWWRRPSAVYDHDPRGLIEEVYPQAAILLLACVEDASAASWALNGMAHAIHCAEDVNPLVDAHLALAGGPDVSLGNSVMEALTALFERLQVVSGFPQFTKTVAEVRAAADVLRTEAHAMDEHCRTSTPHRMP
ncbi:hypothetical protein AB0F92_34100 [Kitasatospora aureofaciens]|uniref:hypothetical protein n=1 Tax=Kitasatospora aureofaciens TaxID=1894 RepID=UPI0033ED218D